MGKLVTILRCQYVMSLQNKGLKHYASLEDILLPANSCPFELNAGVRGAIRVRFDHDLIELEVRQATTGANPDFVPCMRTVYQDPFKPHFGLTASNFLGQVNDIDILGVYFKNMDNRVYQDAAELENLRLNLMLQKHQNSQ